MSLNVIPIPNRIPRWTFAERARKVRRDMGYTQHQMADALDVGLQRYSAWETGRNAPEHIAEVAVALERLTGVPRGWFLGWMDDAPSVASEPDPTRPANGASGANLRPSDYKTAVASLDDYRARKAS